MGHRGSCCDVCRRVFCLFFKRTAIIRMTKIFPRWLKVFPGSFPIQEPQEMQTWSWDQEDSPWSRKWQPTQFSCLENSMGRAAWQSTVHRVEKRLRHDLVTEHTRRTFFFFFHSHDTQQLLLCCLKIFLKFFCTQWNTLACRKWETFKVKQLTQTWEWLGD